MLCWIRIAFRIASIPESSGLPRSYAFHRRGCDGRLRQDCDGLARPARANLILSANCAPSKSSRFLFPLRRPAARRFGRGGHRADAAQLTFSRSTFVSLVCAFDTVFIFLAIVRQSFGDLVSPGRGCKALVTIRMELHDLPDVELVHLDHRFSDRHDLPITTAVRSISCVEALLPASHRARRLFAELRPQYA
jgi:hypothetical protein